MEKRNHLTLVKNQPRVAQIAISAMAEILMQEGFDRLTDPFWRNWLLQIGAISYEYHQKLVEKIER